MIGTRDITQMCFSSNLAGIVANKIEQSFYCLFLFRNRVNQTRPKLNIFQVSGGHLIVTFLTIEYRAE